MVIFINSNGTISTIIPSVVTQGSNNTQSIVLIAENISQFSAVSIDFELPNGQYIDGGIMLPSDITIGGNLFNAYSYVLSNSLTNFVGKVEVGFSIQDPNSAVLKTYNSNFTVVETNEPVLPEVPDIDVYEQILNGYAYLLGVINTGQLMSKCILPYDNLFSYANNALTFNVLENGFVDFYRSLVDDNIGNDLSDGEFWQKQDNYYTKSEVDIILDDYYTKTETGEVLGDYYTKTASDNKFLVKDFSELAEQITAQITDLIAIKRNDDNYKMSLETLRTYLTQGLVSLQFRIVEELPLIGYTNIIYLTPVVPDKEIYPTLEDFPEIGDEDIRYIAEDTGINYLWDGDTYIIYNKGYIEYIWLEDLAKYESLGSTDIDLSVYYTKSEIDTILSNYYTKTETEGKLATKEPLLPSEPTEDEESKFLGWDGTGNKIWKTIPSMVGGLLTANIYLTEIESTIDNTYKQLSYEFEPTTTIRTKTVNDNTKLLDTYLFDYPIATTSIDSGSWKLSVWCRVSIANGATRLTAEIFKRATDGTETTLFTTNSIDINNTTYSYVEITSIQPAFAVLETDKIGVRLYIGTTHTSPVQFDYHIGDGFGAFLNIPLALRHNQLRDLNGNDSYLHITSEEKADFNSKQSAKPNGTDDLINSVTGRIDEVYNTITDLPNKADKDASNLTSENVTSWQEKLGNSLLIADVTLETSASSITINDLDINRDGGVYDFVCIAQGSSSEGISLRINNIITGYYSTINRVNSTLSVIGAATNQCYYFNNAASLFMGDVMNDELTLITGTICVDVSPTTLYASCNGLLTTQGAGKQSSGTFGGKVYSNSHNNITSITILSGTTLLSGMRIRIYKRAVNEV